MVEVGSSFGQASATLAANAPAGTTVYCLGAWMPEVDQALSLETFERNTSGLSNIISLPGHSPRDYLGWQRRVDLLYVNNLHSRTAFCQNMAFWVRVMQPRGCICGHGYSSDFPEVVAEVDRLAAALGAIVEAAGGIWSMVAPDRPLREE
jgi:hypothetical protein